MKFHFHHNKVIHNTLLVKAAISCGFLLMIFLPEGWKELAALSINFLWLWKG